MSPSHAFELNDSATELFTAQGLIESNLPFPPHLQLFVEQSEQVLERVRSMVSHGEMPAERAAEFQRLLVQAGQTVLCHPIIANNRYLQRFAQGVTVSQARHELQQFSVFAAQFNAAQALLVANAPTFEAYRERLHVLLNEEGIPYKEGFEGELTGQWSLETVHYSWLRRMASDLDLSFENIGKIWLASPGTRRFVDAVFKYYASPDQNHAQGASFGIENWAANSLWQPWIAGMKQLNATLPKKIDLGYLTYHDLEERHHSQATIDELFENFLEPWFDSGQFLAGASAILNEGVQPYYESQLETLPGKDGSWPEQIH